MTEKILSNHEIADWPVRHGDAKSQGLAVRQVLAKAGFAGPSQIAGPYLPVACIALEITQRCNLDCTLCYLSEHSEATHDLPLEEVFRRIDAIVEMYGSGRNIQITGGDPTLRNPDELVAIVERCAKKGLLPALFTNGIKATRPLLQRLAKAGLRDVAFHVDMTQERKSYGSEVALNDLRLTYIERAKGLGLHILFNTTVTESTLEELPDILAFFRSQAQYVHLASFQPEAAVGRGIAEAPVESVDLSRTIATIQKSFDRNLGFGRIRIGHPDCNQYTTCLVAGERMVPLIGDLQLARTLFDHVQGKHDFLAERHRIGRMIWLGLGIVIANVRFWPEMAKEIRRLYIGLGGLRNLIANRFAVHKLSLHVHDFMDSTRLNKERCESCVFLVATRDGPMSMCVHNAQRDAMILQTIEKSNGDLWHPLGKKGSDIRPDPLSHGIKKTKGRARRVLLSMRPAQTAQRQLDVIGS